MTVRREAGYPHLLIKILETTGRRQAGAPLTPDREAAGGRSIGPCS
ncbi:MAG: hypothetical protein WAW37_05460 [Syntrophobacteraceae bacterium]